MVWFGRIRDITTGEIHSLYEVDEMFGEEIGFIRCFIKKPVKSPNFKEEWVECDLELFTGFYDCDKCHIYENDKIIYNDNEFTVTFNRFLGQWVVVGDSGQAPLFDIAHKCKILEEK